MTELVSTPVNDYFKYTMMVLNPFGLFFSIVICNLLPEIPFLGLKDETNFSDSFGAADIGMTANGTLRNFRASGYAFSIWFPIYLLLGGFAIYQAIPAEWMSGFLVKNEDLIFNQINVFFFLNMLANGTWFAFARIDTNLSLWVKTLAILFMFGTALYM